jgi:hypothetical protein
MSVSQHHPRHLPRKSPALWPAALSVLAAAAVYAELPDALRGGPRWLLPVVVGVLLLISAGSHWRGYQRITPWLGRALTVLVTIALAASVVLLVATLPGSRTPGRELLVYVILLWSLNVGVFALWYWEIDGGGPHRRHPGSYGFSDVIFPQFQQDPDNAASYWMPGYIDYLFLSFNTSTAFGPTDTLIMSKRVKVLMMAESGLSLIQIAILAARAISVL